MRLLEKNKQNLKYALQVGEVPIYERDEEGNIIYIDVDGQKVPVETGETEIGYAIPVSFRGNIAMSGGEVKSVEYGIDVSSYDAILLMKKGEIPITETSIIWLDSNVGYVDEEKNIIDAKTADYKVLQVKPSQNFTRYILGRLVK